MDARYEQMPEKFEVVRGKLFGSAQQGRDMLGLLLENVGVDATVDRRARRG